MDGVGVVYEVDHQNQQQQEEEGSFQGEGSDANQQMSDVQNAGGTSDAEEKLYPGKLFVGGVSWEVGLVKAELVVSKLH